MNNPAEDPAPAPLSATDRQVFLDLTEGQATPDEVRSIRVSSLLRKWMDGARLSASERDEIAHLLPDASNIITEATPLPQRPGSLTRDEIQTLYNISRAKYFRWKQDGDAVPEGPDEPPFDNPKGMVAWYERMKARGIYKHKCPKLLHDLATKGFPSPNSPGTAASTPHTAAAQQQHHAPGNHRAAPEQRGFLVEHEKLEEHTAILREDYLNAYARGETEAGNLLKQRYFEAYDLLRKSASQKEAVGISEGSLAKKADVVEDLGAIIPAIVRTLISEPHIRSIYTGLQIDTPFTLFAASVVASTKAAFEGLTKSKFAQPYAFDS